MAAGATAVVASAAAAAACVAVDVAATGAVDIPWVLSCWSVPGCDGDGGGGLAVGCWAAPALLLLLGAAFPAAAGMSVSRNAQSSSLLCRAGSLC